MLLANPELGLKSYTPDSFNASLTYRSGGGSLSKLKNSKTSGTLTGKTSDYRVPKKERRTSELEGWSEGEILVSDVLQEVLGEANSNVLLPTHGLPSNSLLLISSLERQSLQTDITKSILKINPPKTYSTLGEHLLKASGRGIKGEDNKGIFFKGNVRRSNTKFEYDVEALIPKSTSEILAQTLQKPLQTPLQTSDRKNSLYALLGFVPPLLSYKHQHAPKSNTSPSLELMKVFSYTSTLSSSSFLSSSELNWIKNYSKDISSYKSYNMWLQKTGAELRELSSYCNCEEGSNERKLSPKIGAAVWGQLLCEEEGGVEGGILDSLLKSVFVLGADEMDAHNNLKDSSATSSYALKVLRRSRPGNIEFNNSVPSLTGRTYKGYNTRMNVFVNIPTWIDACSFWQKRLDKEMELQPYLQKLRLKMKREKKIENGVLNRTCDAWTKPMMTLYMWNWRVNCDMDKNRELLGKYVLKCTELKPSHVFAAWKKWAFWCKNRRAAEELEAVMKKIEELKIDLKDTNDRASIVRKNVSKARADNQKIQKELDKALTKLNMPARQPPTLAKIVSKFSTSLSKSKTFVDPFLNDCNEDLLIAEPHTIRLAPAYKFTSDLSSTSVIDNPDFDKRDESSLGQDKDNAIRLWRPGQLKGAEEFTYASKPGLSSAGKVVKRWIINLLKARWLRKGESCDAAKLEKIFEAGGIGLEGEDAAQMLLSVVSEVSKLHPAMTEKDFLQRFEDYGDFDDNSSIESMEDEEYLKFHERNPHVNDTNAVLTVLTQMTQERGKLSDRFRYVEQTDFTEAKEPESKKKRLIREAHLKQAQKREADSGIVVNMFSKYMGRRIPIIDAFVQKRFAFYAELFFAYFETQQEVPGLKKWVKVSTEEMGVAFSEFETIHTDLAYYEPTHYTHEDLLLIAEKMKELTTTVRSNMTVLFRAYRECLEDRREYREFAPELNRLVWQSLCTTVLSRRVKEESDIDDGTYTRVSDVRMAAEFKRLDILSPVVIEEDVEDMKKTLKGRIRDLKRIFQFYAAAEEGDANSMDSTEYKKFVRDAQLQKNRKLLPSVRVDLIYQACCMDHTKTGKARIDEGGDELIANTWVEAIARLSCYKYEDFEGKKKFTNIADKLERILIDDVLPNACSVDVDVFRDRIDSDRVRDVFTEHKHNLKKIFQVYAADDISSDDAVAANDTMNVAELVSFGRQFNLIGGPPLLSERAVKVLFAYVQQEDPDGEDENGDAIVDDNSEMVISEFKEALAAVGGQLYPDPYNVFDMKLQKFLRKEIISHALSMQRFRKLGAPPKGLKPLRRASMSGGPGGSRPGEALRGQA
ncbi:hypothetical protein TL16_g07793 [Triparma laevis f. inornata]|uniref:Uncharacterized protein n=1 Tax=Triparma laevis f. inornata TaxID=1714386 RepID=A0A9W7AU84_9STRA|nr:hypothetical protein TL16_g07793 [Triparma laevis f. inornata]